MKSKCKILSLCLCAVMLFSAIPLYAAAEQAQSIPGTEKLSSILDFTAMTATDNTVTDGATITAAGAVSSENIRLGGYEKTLASPPGYAGWGNFVQKLEADSGEILTEAEYTLDYWLTKADNNGFVNIYASGDGTSWTKIFEDNSDAEAVKTVTLSLTPYISSNVVYIKFEAAHWDGYTGASAEKSTISGIAASAENYTSSTLDFTAMTADSDKTSAASAIIAAGAVSSENLFLAGNYETIANPGGYAGEGYYIQKLEAPAGKVFTNATLDLDYYLIDANGYVKVFVSDDNSAWTEFFNDSEEDEFKKNATVSLPTGQSTIYVKFVMQHWNTYEGAGIAKSALTGYCYDASLMKTSAINFTNLNATEDKTVAAQEIIAAGAVSAENLLLFGNYETIANPGGYAGWGNYVQKIEAGEGKAFTTASLNLSYYIKETTATTGMVRVFASTDNVNWSKVLWDNTASATKKNAVISLDSFYGASVIYVKVTMAHWETYEGAGVSYSSLSGVAKSVGKTVTDTMNFSSLTATDNAATDSATIIAAGAYDANNIRLGGYEGISAGPAGYQGEGYFVEKISAEKNYKLSNVKFGLNYWLTAENSYIKIFTSVDALNWTQVFADTVLTNDTKSALLSLTALNGADVGYVKVVIANFGGYEGASVMRSCITADEYTELDLDGDGEVNAGDLVVLRKALLETADISSIDADLNSDGQTDIRDLIFLKKCI